MNSPTTRQSFCLPELPACPKRLRETPVDHPATDHEAVRQLTLAITRKMDELIGGISGLSEVFQHGPADTWKLTEVFALIHQSSSRLHGLIAHLKVLHRRATGEATYLNLSRTVRAHFEMFDPLLSDRLVVEMDLATEELAVHLDEARLRRVLLNLTLNLCNALRGRQTADSKLCVSIRVDSDATAQITLAAGGTGEVIETVAPDAAARARVADACEFLVEAGGSFTRRTATDFLLELPVVSSQPSCLSLRHV